MKGEERQEKLDEEAVRMPKANLLRRWVRESLAISFWLHATTNAHILPASLHRLSPDVTKSIYNGLLTVFILYYSWAAKRGWLSLCWDVVFIYFWPFIRISKGIWKATQLSYKFFKSNTTTSPVGLIVVTPAAVKNEAAEPTKKTPTVKEAWDQYKQQRRTKPRRLAEILLRPINKFAILWAVLTLSLSSTCFLIGSLMITLYGATRAVYALWDFLSDTSTWIEKLKGGFSAQMANRMKEVREWEESHDTESITNAVNGLKFYEAIFSFISVNRSFLARCTIGVAIAITVPFYIYVSFLFASIYVGTAHLLHFQFHFADAMVDSLYMPFAFTDLPHSVLIRSLGGLQAIALTLMGWNMFARHLGGKFERLAIAAEEMKRQFNDEVYRAKSARIAYVVQAKKQPASVHPNRKTRRTQIRGTRSSTTAS